MNRNLQEGVERRYRWLGWARERQQGFARSIIKKDAPESTQELRKVYAAQRGVLLRLMLPHQEAITALVTGLSGLRHEMSQGDRLRILKIEGALTQDSLTPEHINTARQIAHKQDVECGFPSFRELDEALSAARGYGERGE